MTERETEGVWAQNQGHPRLTFRRNLIKVLESRGNPRSWKLSKALGVGEPLLKGSFTGRGVPNPETMGKLLEFVQPSDGELDLLVEPWRQTLGRNLPSPTSNLRVGETKDRPWGKVNDEPFAQNLSTLAKSRGLENQSDFAKRLGTVPNVVRGWYRRGHFPTPESMGRILIALKPDAVELESIISLYCAHLEGVVKNRLEFTQKNRDEKPILGWFGELALKRGTTLRNLYKLVHGYSLSYKGKSTVVYSRMLEAIPKMLRLSEEETSEFADAVAQSIQNMTETGEKLNDKIPPSSLETFKEEVSCSTYNGQQAADEMGVSREWVRQLRKVYELPLLMTKEQVAMLKNRSSASNKN